MSYENLIQEAKLLTIEEQFNLISFLLNNLKDKKIESNIEKKQQNKKYSASFLNVFGSGKDLDLELPEEIPMELDLKRESL